MPRGRHRQAPPLHKLLVPSSVAGFAFLCAGGSLLMGDTGLLRGAVFGAAAAAVTGAVLMRAWDRDAGKRVGEVKAAKASAAWQADERQAELEADVEEARELRGKLEKLLRAKRAELTKLRTEHAALLRRYATAETERASALEGRRQLAIAASEPVKELAADTADHRQPSGAPTRLTYLRADEALSNLRRYGYQQERRRQVEAAAAGEGPEKPDDGFDYFGPGRPEQDAQPEPPEPVAEPEAVAEGAEPEPAEPEPEAVAEAGEGLRGLPGQRSRRARPAVGKVVDLAEGESGRDEGPADGDGDEGGGAPDLRRAVS
ncbi:hypothetical protein H3146_04630 [Streptomyces sp. OF3]|uniref:Secreted protein n=1 Tax=Streptomyces alkaliterrae TaxID=2213162 RepID=A0A7W3ZLQ0_9ACTN|nr:hypothetical protein [Streptomyces alkaliterrae]MBB1252656.1 hypothetical protein [Streptomyces alkaliterrae]